VIFLESFKFHHGDKMLIILSGRELKTENIRQLNSLYSNLKVINKKFDVDRMAETCKLSKEVLLKYKYQVEHSHVTENNKVWKNIIADDDRIKEIYQVIEKNLSQKYLLHFDIDMYFRENLDGLFELVKDNDISIRLRLKSKPTRKTMIGVQGYKLKPSILRFMKEWIKNIDSTPVYLRPAGHGQAACFLAYNKFKGNLKWGSVPPRFISPRMLETDAVWSANTVKGKEKTLKLFYKDFNNIKNRGEKVYSSI
jgi:hypothetical protein